MALQTSGAISLNEIHIEAGGTSGTQASINDADILMTDFAVLGFVAYNRGENVIHLNEKLFNFLDVKLKKRDYDGLKIISSVTDKPNAKMDLKSGALSVSGVNYVELSDSNPVSLSVSL